MSERLQHYMTGTKARHHGSRPNGTNLLGRIFINVCILLTYASCIPAIVHTRSSAVFKNCTNDTLFIGASHYNHLDSVGEQLMPHYNILANSDLDTTNTSLWKGIYSWSDCFVYPDSACSVDADYLFQDGDTCYFFLVKWKDAKRHSWDEIRSKNLYNKWIVVKDKDGKFDRNVRYAR